MRRPSIRIIAAVALAGVLVVVGAAQAIGKRDRGDGDPAQDRPLANRAMVEGIDGRDDASFVYRLEVPPGASELVFNAVAKKGSAPVDLYVKREGRPTTKSFDAREIGPAPVKLVAIRHPQPGTWRVLVHGAHGRFDVSLVGSFAPRDAVFKVGMHAHRLYNGGDWSGPASPEPQFRYGVIRDWDISNLHDASIWKPDGSIDFRMVDRVYDGHARNGARVLKTFGSVPTWASKRPDEPNKQYPNWRGGKSGPRDLDEYEDYVYRFIAHERPFLWAVEGWNEPYSCRADGSEFTTMSPTELADVQKRLYRAAKRVDRRLLVLSPAQAYVCGIPLILSAKTSEGEPMWKFFDALSWHAYNRSARGNAGPSYAAEVAEVRRHLAAAGVRDMPIADTEHGWLPAPKEGGREFYDMSDDEKGAVLQETAQLAKSLGVLTVAWYGYDNSMLGKPMASAELSRRLQRIWGDFDTR